MNLEKILYLSLSLFIFSNDVTAQEATKTINRKSAFLFSEASIGLDNIPAHSRYNALIFGGGFTLPLYQAKRKTNLSLDFMPHAAIGYADNVEFEYGLNVQAGLNFQMSERSVLSFKLGTGPHFISYDTDKQRSGFVFSDNFMVVYRRLTKNSTYDIGYKAGVRHLSNLSMRNPNGGLNFINIGIVVRKLWNKP